LWIVVHKSLNVIYWILTEQCSDKISVLTFDEDSASYRSRCRLGYRKTLVVFYEIILVVRLLLNLSRLSLEVIAVFVASRGQSYVVAAVRLYYATWPKRRRTRPVSSFILTLIPIRFGFLCMCIYVCDKKVYSGPTFPIYPWCNIYNTPHNMLPPLRKYMLIN